MTLEVFNQVVVEIFTQQVCCLADKKSGIQVSERLTWWGERDANVNEPPR